MGQWRQLFLFYGVNKIEYIYILKSIQWFKMHFRSRMKLVAIWKNCANSCPIQRLKYSSANSITFPMRLFCRKSATFWIMNLYNAHLICHCLLDTIMPLIYLDFKSTKKKEFVWWEKNICWLGYLLITCPIFFWEKYNIFNLFYSSDNASICNLFTSFV